MPACAEAPPAAPGAGVGGAGARAEAACADRSAAVAATALSHELRTPLNAILANLGLLLDGTAGPLSGEARACLADIQRGARQLLDRVQTLLGEVDRATTDAPRGQTPPSARGQAPPSGSEPSSSGGG